MQTNVTPAALPKNSLRHALSPLRVGLGCLCLAYMASLKASAETQWFASVWIVLLVWLMSTIWRDRTTRPGYEVVRNAMIFLSLAMSLRYLIWRGTETLPIQLGLAAAIAGILLFAAECYGFLVNALRHLPNLRKTQRAAFPLPADPSLLPVVDVYIPTYNEDPELVRSTLIAATQMRYPANKLCVYVLDDGGTASMLAETDSLRAAAAKDRSNKIRRLAAQFGATYLTREKNEHAKAGNLNAALTQTSGAFIVILDCDHVPAEDFIEKTLGFFLADHLLFVVQTPHYFVNPDPVERNLATFHHSPSENDMFYNAIQPGLDAWGATFFCGSAAMLRRSVLDDIGGFLQQTVTEDVETTLRAFTKGYTTAYLNLPLISGLHPETFSGFIQQRARWGQGMWQIFMFYKPWRLPGLSLIKRILFANFALFWGFPISRLILLLMPVITLLLSIPLVDASVIDIIAYGAPALICSTITTQFIHGKVRWPFISYLYEVLQSIHLTGSIMQLLHNPRAPQFKVTPKGEILDKDFVSTLAKPFYILSLLSAAALGMCAYRLGTQTEPREMLLFVGAWALLDLVFILCALGVTLERRQRRAHPRACVRYPVEVSTDTGSVLRGILVDASATGASIELMSAKDANAQLRHSTHLAIRVEGMPQTLHGRLQNMTLLESGRVSLGIMYRFNNIEEERTAVAVPYGSSEQLIKNLERRHRRRSVVSAFLTLLRQAIWRGGWHILVIGANMIRRLGDKLQPATTVTEKKSCS